MASRTSASTGMIVSVSIFGLLFVVFFVLFIISFANAQKLRGELDTAQDVAEQAVLVNFERYDQLKGEAGSSQGVVDYLLAREETAAQIMAGSSEKSLPAAQAKLKAQMVFEGGESPSALSHIRKLNDAIAARESRIASLQADAASAAKARDAALEERDEIRRQYQLAEEASRSEVTEYGDSVNDQVAELRSARDNIDTRLGEIRDEYESVIGSLEDEKRSLEQEMLVLQALLEEAQNKGKGNRPEPRFEGALVDGLIAGVDAPTSQAFINLGSRDRLVNGMTFEVYSDGSAIRPDAEGNYPPGKATIEVIRIGEGSSPCRILRENRGSPIVAGDVIANAVYDPNKTYHFTVFGNFDSNDDGFYTSAEADDVKGIITEWGGLITEEVTGDTDFIVLGARPVPPPQPRADDPIEVILRYQELAQRAAEYDRVFNLAQRTSIPILNENRLYTLTGLYARR